MLNKIIHYSLHNRLVVLCAAVLLLIAGTYTAMNTEVDVFPDLNAPTVDDEEYDRLFDELAQLEKALDTRMGNSPTQTVGWPAREGLDKVSHPIPLLSLDKTKLVDELCAFIGEQPVMLMLKLDGLTIKLTYE